MPTNSTTKADKSQGRFYDALAKVFVGAPVEGQSGFINLMRIKSRYYTDGVFPKLQKDIDQALKPFPGFRQELFDKLYDFFHRYFSPSGSIYFQHTPAHKNIQLLTDIGVLCAPYYVLSASFDASIDFLRVFGTTSVVRRNGRQNGNRWLLQIRQETAATCTG